MINPFVIIGGVLIVIGVAIVGRMTFRFFLFLFKMLFGLSMIYFGYLITQSPTPDYSELTQWIKKENIIFYSNSQASFTPDSGSKFEVYSIAMSTAKIDLSKIKIENENVHIVINSIFSETTVVVNPDSPLVIHSSILKGSAVISGSEPQTSGELEFRTQNATQSKFTIKIDGNAIFGKLHFVTPEDKI